MAPRHLLSLREAVEQASASGLLERVQGLEGYSGEKLLGSLQRCAKYQDESGHGHYLEIGVFRGMSLLSVASVLKNSLAYGVDNFAQFDPEDENQRIIERETKNRDLRNVRLLNLDYENALENLGEQLAGRKIATYFVDGPHDYRSQLTCLNLIRPFLSDRAVIFVDDCNYAHVRLANRDFLLSNPGFKLFFEAYTECHPGNLAEADLTAARQGWWNGVNVIVRDVEGYLKPQYPPTIRDRRLFENEHLIHGDQYGVLAAESMRILSLLRPFRPFRLARTLRELRKKMLETGSESIGRFPVMNTFSDQIMGCRFNDSLDAVKPPEKG